MAYARLRRHLGLVERPVRVYDLIQQLAVIDDDVLEHFSVDTVDEDAYRAYRPDGDLKKVLCNIQSLRRFRDEQKLETPQIEAQALVMRQNEKDIDRFEQTMVEFGADQVRFKTFNAFMCGEEMKGAGVAFIPMIAQHRRYTNVEPHAATDPGDLKVCRWPWDRR